MENRKLKLLLPNMGWLIRRDRWNIGNILKLAGIGKFVEDGNAYAFQSYDPEVQATCMRARNIPRYLIRNSYDVGVTGHDLMREETCKHPDKSPFQIMDLGCSYVDLVFATRPELWLKILEAEKALGNTESQALSGLDLMFKHKRQLSSRVSGGRCATVYPHLAKELLSHYEGNSPPRTFLRVENPKGTLETILKDKLCEVIFETMATGRSMEGQQIVQTAFSSTARLYAGYCPAMNDYTLWKEGKIEDLKKRIDGVLRDIDRLCQIHIENIPGGWVSIRDYLKHKNIPLEGMSVSERDTDRMDADIILDKKYIPEIGKYLSDKRNNMSGTFSALVYDLNLLYAYSPIESSKIIVKGRTCVIRRSKPRDYYPVADWNLLRFEHRDKVAMSFFDGNRFAENPKYDPFFKRN